LETSIQEQSFRPPKRDWVKAQRNVPPPPVPRESPPQGIRKAEIYRQKEQAHFVLGFLGPTLDHQDRTALEVLDAALSGQGGRLFYELRDQESLAYALTFMANPNFDPGFIASKTIQTNSKKRFKAC
jgi:zinc protease